MRTPERSTEPELHLLPTPAVAHQCPICGDRLSPTGVCVPGMRTLARLTCERCETEYYGDLPTGHGLPFPVLLDARTGAVYHHDTLPIFAEHLARSYRERSNEPLPFEVEALAPVTRPIFLNCLDWLYGHSLLKLLNAQYHIDHHRGYDLIVLVPRFLRWLVPAGVAEIWTVDLPLSRGWTWNDWLAGRIAERMETQPEWWLSPAFSHPRPEDVSLERFSRVAPFPLDEWRGRFLERPTVTYVWRGDRDWFPPSAPGRISTLRTRVDRRTGRSLARRIERVTAFAERLRTELGSLDFAVTGLDSAGSFPDWVQDLRDERPTTEIELSWCRRYATSHLVVGVHGSNMLLASGHAGGVLEFVPDAPWDSRWGNVVEDLLLRGDDARDLMFRHRFLPVATRVEDAARVAASMMRDRPSAHLLLDPASNDHELVGAIWEGLPGRLAQEESTGHRTSGGL